MLKTNTFRKNQAFTGPMWYENLPEYRTFCCCLSLNFAQHLIGILCWMFALFSLIIWVIFGLARRWEQIYYAISFSTLVVPGIAYLIHLCDTHDQARAIGYASSYLFVSVVNFITPILIMALNPMDNSSYWLITLGLIFRLLIDLHNFLLIMSYARKTDGDTKKIERKPALTFSKCCLCVNLKLGSYLIGILNMVSVILSIPFFVLFSFTNSYIYLTLGIVMVIAIVPSVAFIMLVRDPLNETKRSFFAYCNLLTLSLAYIGDMVYAAIYAQVLHMILVSLVVLPLFLYLFLVLRSYALLDTQAEFEASYRKSLERAAENTIEDIEDTEQ